MSVCQLCPRNCRVDRSVSTGVCGAGAEIRIARADLHFWEEPCISGAEGSGAVFFAGCNLHCVYCQNHAISGGSVGKCVSVEALAETFLRLQEKKARNINLVTGTHYVPQIIEALDSARRQGLWLPVVYNTSGYETEENIQRLQGYVDVYLPDFKYVSEDLALQFSHAKDYPEVARKALEAMVSQMERTTNRHGLTEDTPKVIVRHLVLPGHTSESKQVLSYLHETYGDRIHISIMSQYTPVVETPFAELNRRLTKREYAKVVDYALELGITNAFIQEGEVAKESFIPEFMIE